MLPVGHTRLEGALNCNMELKEEEILHFDKGLYSRRLFFVHLSTENYHLERKRLSQYSVKAERILNLIYALVKAKTINTNVKDR